MEEKKYHIDESKIAGDKVCGHLLFMHLLHQSLYLIT